LIYVWFKTKTENVSNIMGFSLQNENK